MSDEIKSDSESEDSLEDAWRLAESTPADEADEADAWPSDDLEAAYLKALEASAAVEWQLDHEAPQNDAGEDDSHSEATVAAASAGDGSATPPVPAASEAVTSADIAVTPARVTAEQVIEAALFVGGQPLTSRKLCQMLRGDYDLDAIEQAIDDLNRRYAEQLRPYEIRLGEGGYRMTLRDEYERLRHRVYGIGPREVKLSQDVLEVLALVAYRQPITQTQIEELGKAGPGPALRQLLRRELISLNRDAEDRKRVTYCTTRRFLTLFGLGSLNDLPQASELAFK